MSPVRSGIAYSEYCFRSLLLRGTISSCMSRMKTNIETIICYALHKWTLFHRLHSEYQAKRHPFNMYDKRVRDKGNARLNKADPYVATKLPNPQERIRITVCPRRWSVVDQGRINDRRATVVLFNVLWDCVGQMIIEASYLLHSEYKVLRSQEYFITCGECRLQSHSTRRL